MSAMCFASLCLLLACASGAEPAVAGCAAGAAGEGCAAEAEEAAMVQVRIGQRGQACRTTGGAPCVFPFIYSGVTYNGCTDAEHNALWCSTQTDGGGQHVAGKWGDCLRTCPEAGAEASKARADTFGYSTFQQGDWAETYPLCSGQETPDAADNQWQAPINFNLSAAYEELCDDDFPKFYAKDGGCKRGYFFARPYAWQVNFVDAENVDCTNLEMEWKGKVYELIQFHFHTLSEDTFDFDHFPMQMHMVHAAEDGSLAVVGVQVEYATAGSAPNRFLTHVFKEGFETDRVVKKRSRFNPYEEVLAEGQKLWHYQGSLTTPPCSPGVNFLIAQKPVLLHQDFIAGYKDYLVSTGAGDSYGHNNRPAQPLNMRTVGLGEFGAIKSGRWAPPVHVGMDAVRAGVEA